MNPAMGGLPDYQRYISPSSDTSRHIPQLMNQYLYQPPPQMAQRVAPQSPQPQPQPQAHGQYAQQPPQAPPPPAEGQPAMQAQMAQNLGHHQIHPPVAAIPPLLRMIWPHLWLIVRLSLFVWMFTSPGSGWSRWLTIVGLAVFIFVFSTGALNGVAEHVMRPVGRHLDNLLPALDGQHGQGNAPRPAANQQGAAAAGPNPEPQPAQLADRLLNDRQAQQGWFTGQFRRVERASLLFLASIAPGVAERHIAHLEAEAARRRREAEEAARAAAEAAEAANQNNEAQAEGAERTQEEPAPQTQGTDTNNRTEQERDNPALQGHEREAEAAPEPLLAL